MNTENWIKIAVTVVYGALMYSLGYFVGRIRLFSKKAYAEWKKEFDKQKWKAMPCRFCDNTEGLTQCPICHNFVCQECMCEDKTMCLICWQFSEK